jgi:hypothetical protein
LSLLVSVGIAGPVPVWIAVAIFFCCASIIILRPTSLANLFASSTLTGFFAIGAINGVPRIQIWIMLDNIFKGICLIYLHWQPRLGQTTGWCVQFSSSQIHHETVQTQHSNAPFRRPP